ncbi:hypothetical protein [Brevundimonas sp.]|uniref:hypothetical protein n=1 Tax=Brevundimonas sp. TaxID=1871086 RepID=UPI00289A6688|nr:hypothetical protein [Brevundimonas sp.]
MKGAYVVVGLSVVMSGCVADRTPPATALIASANVSPEVQRCVPLQTKATFSCWWSGPDAPLTHCVNYSDEAPACNLKARGGAYLGRGAPGGGNMLEQQKPKWQIISVFADAEGRVGLAAERMDGTRFLSHHDQSPPPDGRPSVPVWPRWPAGLEFGPEQTVRR